MIPAPTHTTNRKIDVFLFWNYIQYFIIKMGKQKPTKMIDAEFEDDGKAEWE